MPEGMQLPLNVITQESGWCDEPAHPSYNQFVSLPFDKSHEKMWRDDDLYDIVLVIGHNDSPIVPGKGSAVFVHIAKPDWGGTEGCIGLSKPSLLELLPQLTTETILDIKGE